MATNPTANYGTDIRCFQDADPFWSTVTGVDLVRQDAFHRITTDDVLGPDGVAWGRDVRKLLGAPARDLPAQQAVFQEVLLRDPRIQSATVTLTATSRGGVADVQFVAECTTALGPFELVLSVQELTTATIDAQGQ